MTVYFIREKETDFVKIGNTFRDIRKRLGALQTGNPRELELLAFTNHESEKHYHQIFAAKHARGEWFKLDQDDIVSLPGKIEFQRPLWVDRICWELIHSYPDEKPPEYYIADICDKDGYHWERVP